MTLPRVGAFVALFAVLYGLLIAPWPGVESGYGAWFRLMGNATLGPAVVLTGGGRYARFEPYPDALRDTQLVVGQRRRGGEQGNEGAVSQGAPGTSRPLASRRKGYLSTAMVMALVLATPLPWRRRMVALGWALLGVNLFIGFRLSIVVLRELTRDTSYALFVPGDLINTVMRLSTQVFYKGYAMSFAVPVLIWLAVCLRGDGLQLLNRNSDF